MASATFELAHKRMSTVYFSDSLDRYSFTMRVLEIFKEPLENAGKIFVKPNIVSYEPYPTTTHPEILETVLKQLSNHEVVVGDAPAIDAGRSGKIIQESPLKQVCDRHGVRLINLYSKEMKTVKSSRNYKIRISTLPLNCDYIISLPILKIHFMVGLSGALKNQFGYLSKRDRILMHSGIKNIDKGIAEVNAAVPTDLFIVDAVETMIDAQEYRHGGHSAKLGFLIAGIDPVALDCFGLQLLEKAESEFENKRQKSPRYIEYAESYGVGKSDYKTLQI